MVAIAAYIKKSGSWLIGFVIFFKILIIKIKKLRKESEI